MKKSSKIAYLTSTRSEFGLMKPTLELLNKKFDLKLIVTGTHLLKKYGNTIEEIKKSKLPITSIIKTSPHSDNRSSTLDFLGNLMVKLDKVIKKIKPDLVLIEGDRGEQLIFALVASHNNIPIAHTSGGVHSKSVDDMTRNAITKFANLHLAPSINSAKRIVKMNEEKWRVHVVGPPLNLNFKKIDIEKKFGIKQNQKFLIVLQHPVNTQYLESRKQIHETLEAIKSISLPTIIIYPNSDIGSEEIIKEIHSFGNLSYVKIIPNVNNNDFMNLLSKTAVLIGNSSAGIVEAPFFNTPVVNIGIRQNNREHGSNVSNTSHNRKAIEKAIRKMLKKSGSNFSNPYKTNFKTEDKILKIFSDLKIDEKFLSKEPWY